MKKTNQRTESDSLGKIQIPKDSYFGSNTMRALKNFQISDELAPSVFRESLGLVKLAAAKSNHKLKIIDSKQFKAIKKATEEFIEGQFNEDFILDTFQAGAGTSYNMNANEIIANRANEILKGKKGEYAFVHPNNHVNYGQSTNDTIPTATKIATLLSTPELLSEIASLEESFEAIAIKHQDTLKVARTHLQDAVPISLGQSFDSYREALKKSREQIEAQSQTLQVLGVGGTAVGTGINTDPKYKQLVIKNLTEITGIYFESGSNLTEMANNFTDFMNFSGALRSLATNLLNISLDLKLMNTGPKTGFLEITLPPVQPGSSIMPGKINPSIPECLEMICMQVLGNDKVIELAAQRSNFELNVFCPLIMKNLLESINILTNGLKMFSKLAIKGLKVNTKEIQEQYENSLVTATALAPHIGYKETADIVKSSLKYGHSIKEEVEKRKLLSTKKLEKIFSVQNQTQPNKI
jgi:aspartate ammonia-lyase